MNNYRVIIDDGRTAYFDTYKDASKYAYKFITPKRLDINNSVIIELWTDDNWWKISFIKDGEFVEIEDFNDYEKL